MLAGKEAASASVAWPVSPGISALSPGTSVLYSIFNPYPWRKRLDNLNDDGNVVCKAVDGMSQGSHTTIQPFYCSGTLAGIVTSQGNANLSKALIVTK